MAIAGIVVPFMGVSSGHSRVRGNDGRGIADPTDFGSTDLLVERAVFLTTRVSADLNDSTSERASIDVSERDIIFKYSKNETKELLGY
jgi:hypothetical protein